MKIYAIIAALFLIAGCAHHSNNSSAVNIDGTWKGGVDLGIRIGKPGEPPRSVTTYLTFNFKREGDIVKGTVSGRPGPGTWKFEREGDTIKRTLISRSENWIPLEDINIKGKKISFTVTSMMFSTEVKTNYTGKIEGEKINLSFKTDMPASFIGPGSPNPRVTDVNMRHNGAGMGRGRNHIMGDVKGGDTGGNTIINSGNQAGLSLAYGVGNPGPGNPNPMRKITIERISKIPQNPVD